MSLRILVAIATLILLSTTADAKHYRHYRHHHRTAISYQEGTIIGHRPAGCPHAYCGCGLRLYLGIDDKRLNLAWNWTRYYRGNRVIAVWRHHVALVEHLNGDGTALLRDYNSGRGLSRLHVRSIRGARLVNGGSYSLLSARAVASAD